MTVRLWRTIGIVVGLVLANGALVAIIVLAVGQAPPQPVVGSPTASPRPSPPPSPAAPTAPPAPLVPLPLPSPTPRPRPTLTRPLPGELPPNTAILTFIPEGGFPTTVDRLQATCNRRGDSLGLIGSYLGGPYPARYQIAIAPFHGSASYRNTAASAEIGGSVSISGVFQMFLGPPYDAQAEVARDGALGQLAFSGVGVDGHRGDGVLRWECSAIQ